MDMTKLLYVIPPWKPTRTHNMKPSYLRLRAVFQDRARTQWEVFVSRDSMGLGWITLNQPGDYDVIAFKNVKYAVRDYDFNKDQVLRNWIVLNLCIRTRKGRMALINQLIEKAINWFMEHPEHRNICIPRMIVFKENDRELSYSYEMINGDSTKDVCESVGCETILNQPIYTTKGIFKSPVAGGATPQPRQGGRRGHEEEEQPSDDDDDDDDRSVSPLGDNLVFSSGRGFP